MAMIKKDGNFMGLPMNIARGNPIPLDKSEIWYSYEAMVDYAINNPIAYVGQILGLVDEEQEVAKAYIILNTAGDLQEIATSESVPTLLGDNATISISDDIVALKDWGVQYYKYVPAEGVEGEEGYVEAKYELQTVDAEHPWVIGLEPRVTFEKGQLVLGWFEQNPTTIEGINAQISSLQTSVDGLQEETSKLISAVGHPADQEAGTAATGIYADFYTKNETDTRIANAVADVSHLKRKEVASLDEIDIYANNADQFIYMVPSGLQDDDNKFYEYIIIVKEVVDEASGNLVEERDIERVGSWEVNLSEYAKKSELDNYVKTEVLNDYVKTEILDDYAKAEDLKDYAKTEDLTNYENYISSVDEENFAVEDGKLSLITITQKQVSGLEEALLKKANEEEFKVVSGKVANLDKVLNGYTDENGEAVEGLTAIVSTLSLQMQDKAEQADLIITNNTVKSLENLLNGYVDDEGSEVAGLVSVVSNITTKLDGLEDAVSNLDDSYVSIANFTKVVGNLDTLLANNFNVVDAIGDVNAAIDDINDRLTWQDLIIEEIV